jgi:hypothetical protein
MSAAFEPLASAAERLLSASLRPLSPPSPSLSSSLSSSLSFGRPPPFLQ